MIDFKIVPDEGEPYEIKATSRDVDIWERGGPNRAIGQVLAELSMKSMFEIAHVAVRRQQQYPGTLKEFRESCELEFEAPEDVDPTQSDHSTGQ